jgi:hypothetical protein
MSKKDKEVLMEEILNFCSVARKAKHIADHLGLNQNTLRSHYLYPMVKNGKLIRTNGITFYKKVD